MKSISYFFTVHSKRLAHTAFICCMLVLISAAAADTSIPVEPPGINIFRKAYPDVLFETVYDKKLQDWKITVHSIYNNTVLYWAQGRLLPKEELAHADKYTALLYSYPKKVKNPSTFSTAEIKAIKEYSSKENRQHGASTALYFFDAIYDAASRRAVEQHITRIDFLGKRVSVHKKIVKPLQNVEKKINAEAKTDSEVKNFLTSISRTDGYLWREIRDKSTRSFHSFGLAVDILPKHWGSKIIYWGWQRDNDPDKWMLTPLSKRWMPPQKVIEAFESEGFVWGGKWNIWDNMHFEYRPDLIIYNK